MHRSAAVAATVLTLLSPVGMAPAGPARAAVAALSPYTATRLGHRPRAIRAVHCERKADSVGVQGKAREIYLRKCGNG